MQQLGHHHGLDQEALRRNAEVYRQTPASGASRAPDWPRT
jgi:hypothetical protein